jgi:GMP synthase-like glutamine amidotransferase
MTDERVNLRSASSLQVNRVADGRQRHGSLVTESAQPLNLYIFWLCQIAETSTFLIVAATTVSTDSSPRPPTMALPSQASMRIAMLNADTPVPNVRAKMGSYGDIFFRLIRAAASRIAPHLSIDYQNFDVVLGQYPPQVCDFDMVLVTGSAASAYDKAEWIDQLDVFLRDVYHNHTQVKIFGSCFGHQIIGRSLFSKSDGVVVEKDPVGWEIGVKDVELSSEFVNAFKSTKTRTDGWATPEVQQAHYPPSCLRLQMVHSDHVRVSKTLPAPWVLVGGTSHCVNQGMYNPGRVLTFQGHFEFDRFINSETVKVFGASWDPQVLQKFLDDCDLDDDAEAAAEFVVRFMVDGKAPKASSSGLITPPVTGDDDRTRA